MMNYTAQINKAATADGHRHHVARIGWHDPNRSQERPILCGAVNGGAFCFGANLETSNVSKLSSSRLPN